MFKESPYPINIWETTPKRPLPQRSTRSAIRGPTVHVRDRLRHYTEFTRSETRGQSYVSTATTGVVLPTRPGTEDYPVYPVSQSDELHPSPESVGQESETLRL